MIETIQNLSVFLIPPIIVVLSNQPKFFNLVVSPTLLFSTSFLFSGNLFTFKCFPVTNSTTSITNSIDYGIKAYFGKFWNYGTMSISDNNDGDYAVLIDRSGAYLGNMTITGGTGNDPLIGIYNSYSTVIENSSGESTSRKIIIVLHTKERWIFVI